MSADFQTDNYKGYLHGESIFVTTKENDGWGVMVDREMLSELVQMFKALDMVRGIGQIMCVRCNDCCDLEGDDIQMIDGEPVCVMCRKGRED